MESNINISMIFPTVIKKLKAIIKKKPSKPKLWNKLNKLRNIKKVRVKDTTNIVFQTLWIWWWWRVFLIDCVGGNRWTPKKINDLFFRYFCSRMNDCSFAEIGILYNYLWVSSTKMQSISQRIRTMVFMFNFLWMILLSDNE